MTGNQTSHVAATYKDSGGKMTRTYAVSDTVLRELGRTRDWLGRRLVGKDLNIWLAKKGCRLDSSDGPALSWHTTDGAVREEYYRDGELHRDGGPALVWCYAPAWRHAFGDTEAYYHDGKLHRDNGPAYVNSADDGETAEGYYRDGKLHRDNGPAIVKRHAVGATEEEYYLDGVEYRKDEYDAKRNPTLKPPRPGPKAPDNPSAPGPA